MTQAEEEKIIELLEKLTPAAFDRILIRIPGAAGHVRDNGPQHSRVMDLILFVRSPTGPGMEGLRDTIERITRDCSEKPLLSSGPNSDTNNPTGEMILDLNVSLDDLRNDGVLSILTQIKDATGCELRLTIKRILVGSVRLVFNGTRDTFERLSTLIELGVLEKRIGIPIERIEWEGQVIPSSAVDFETSQLGVQNRPATSTIRIKRLPIELFDDLRQHATNHGVRIGEYCRQVLEFAVAHPHEYTPPFWDTLVETRTTSLTIPVADEEFKRQLLSLNSVKFPDYSAATQAILSKHLDLLDLERAYEHQEQVRLEWERKQQTPQERQAGQQQERQERRVRQQQEREERLARQRREQQERQVEERRAKERREQQNRLAMEQQALARQEYVESFRTRDAPPVRDTEPVRDAEGLVGVASRGSRRSYSEESEKEAGNSGTEQPKAREHEAGN